MTGYGRAVATIDGREITAEIRSVNNRYLDCTVKMPRLYAYAEDGVKSRVKASISRGKVDVFIAVNVMEDTQMRVCVNRPVLEGYLNAMKSIAADYDVRDDITVTALSRLPDVFSVEKAEEDEEKLDSSFGAKAMLPLAVATSIDALAVGITFAFLNYPIGEAVMIIGLTTFCISTGGVYVGNFFGNRYKKKAELAGGIILVLIGVKILLEHLGFVG